MPPRNPAPRVAIHSSQRALRVPRKRLCELVRFVAAAERTAVADVDIAVVDAEEIAALNSRYLGRPEPTDVLSFDLTAPGGGTVSAQIVVCADVAAAEAAARGIPASHELMLYVTHGLLHLLGYDDATGPAAARMHARQERLLAEFLARRRR